MIDMTIKMIADVYKLLGTNDNDEIEEVLSFILIFVPLLTYFLPKIMKVVVEGISELPIEKITMTNYQKFKQIFNITIFSFIYFMIIFIFMLGNDYKEMLSAAIILSVALILFVFLIVFVPSNLISLKYDYFIDEDGASYKLKYKRDNYYLFEKVVEDFKDENFIFKENINDINIRYAIKELNWIQKKLVNKNRKIILRSIIGVLLIAFFIFMVIVPNLILLIITIILLFFFIMIQLNNKKLRKNIKRINSLT